MICHIRILIGLMLSHSYGDYFKENVQCLQCSMQIPIQYVREHFQSGPCTALHALTFLFLQQLLDSRKLLSCEV